MSQTAFPLDDTPYLAQDLRLWHIGRTTGIINATVTDFTVTPVDGINGFAWICLYQRRCRLLWRIGLRLDRNR